MQLLFLFICPILVNVAAAVPLGGVQHAHHYALERRVFSGTVFRAPEQKGPFTTSRARQETRKVVAEDGKYIKDLTRASRAGWGFAEAQFRFFT